MKKYIVFFWIAVLLMGLCACGSSDFAGKYGGIYAEAEGKTYLMEDYFNGENYLELKSRGKAVMMVNNKEHELTWKHKDGELTFTEAGDPFYSTIYNGVIELDYMGWGLKLTFALDGTEIPETTVQNPSAHEEAVHGILPYWNGDWYGWWYISEGTGDYAGEQLKMRDAVARITLGEDARGSIRIWDMEHPYENPLAECVLRVDPTTGHENIGIAMSGQGSFMGQPVLAGDWLIDPSMGAYDNLLEISGYYKDEKGDFFYVLYLRPWGQGWEDVLEAADPNTMPNELPQYYDLYLEALKTQTPPEEFLGT